MTTMTRWTRLVIHRNRWRIHQYLQDNPNEFLGPCKYSSKSLCECDRLADRDLKPTYQSMGPLRWPDGRPEHIR